MLTMTINAIPVMSRIPNLAMRIDYSDDGFIARRYVLIRAAFGTMTAGPGTVFDVKWLWGLSTGVLAGIIEAISGRGAAW